jgi:hypothetical protein
MLLANKINDLTGLKEYNSDAEEWQIKTLHTKVSRMKQSEISSTL